MGHFLGFSSSLSALSFSLLLTGTALVSACGDDGESSQEIDGGVSSDADTNVADADPNAPDAQLERPDAAVEFEGNSAMLWVGDLTADNVDEIVHYDGENASNLSIPGVTQVDEIMDIASSPNGDQLAVALRHDGGPAKLYRFNSDGSGAATELFSHDKEELSSKIKNLAWSPDGSHIAFLSDKLALTAFLVYSVPSDAGEAATIVSQIPPSSLQNAYALSWHDDKHLVYFGDLVVNNEYNAFISDISLSPIAPIQIIPSEDFIGREGPRYITQSANGKIHFVSRHTGRLLLYRVDPNGQNLELLPSFDALSNNTGQASVGAFAISPDGTKIAFSADSPKRNLYQVFVADINGDTASVQSNITEDSDPNIVGGPVGERVLRWRRDQEMLAVIANWPTDDIPTSDSSAFVVPASGPAGGTRIWAPAAEDSNLTPMDIHFSSDSSQLYLHGDMRRENTFNVYTTSDFSSSDQAIGTTAVYELEDANDVRFVRPIHP